MPCACNGGATQESSRDEQEYAVTLPNGRTEIVKGEHNARVLVTQAGGGSYKPR